MFLAIVATIPLLAILLSSSHGFTIVRQGTTDGHVRPAVPLLLPQVPAAARRVLSKKKNDRPRPFPIASSRTTTSLFAATPADRPVLAAVDGLALLAFAAIGKSSHAADGSVDVAATVAVAAPFLLSWFATSPWTKVYDERDGGNGTVGGEETVPTTTTGLIVDVIIQTARGWIVAVPTGIVLRGLLKGYVPPTSFIVVTMVATLVILTLARVAYALTEQKLLSSSTST
jgi:hypothetical protein